AERCELVEGGKAHVKALYESYGEWCKANDEEPLSKRAWGQRLDDRGIASDRLKATGERIRTGIAITGPTSDASRRPDRDLFPSKPSREEIPETDVGRRRTSDAPCPDHGVAAAGYCQCWRRNHPA